MKPRISILSKDFVYRDSASTNVRLTFGRVRRQQRADSAVTKPAPIVVNLKREKK
jgi:hypothetical protein